jgi:hypothetical protein
VAATTDMTGHLPFIVILFLVLVLTEACESGFPFAVCSDSSRGSPISRFVFLDIPADFLKNPAPGMSPFLEHLRDLEVTS